MTNSFKFKKNLASENFYAENRDGSLTKTQPARIVCYDEGDGEWTIDAEDESCRCLRDERGNYPASVWHNEENGFSPITKTQAVAIATKLRRSLRREDLPIYVDSPGNGCEAVE